MFKLAYGWYVFINWFLYLAFYFTERDIELPEHFDIFHLKSEIDPTDKTALEAVLDVDQERKRLETEADWLVEHDMGDSDRLVDVYERLDQMEAGKGQEVPY